MSKDINIRVQAQKIMASETGPNKKAIDSPEEAAQILDLINEAEKPTDAEYLVNLWFKYDEAQEKEKFKIQEQKDNEVIQELTIDYKAAEATPSRDDDLKAIDTAGDFEIKRILSGTMDITGSHVYDAIKTNDPTGLTNEERKAYVKVRQMLDDYTLSLKDGEDLPQAFVNFIVQSQTGHFDKYPAGMRSMLEKNVMRKTLEGLDTSWSIIEYKAKGDIDKKNQAEISMVKQNADKDARVGFAKDAYRTLIGEEPNF